MSADIYLHADNCCSAHNHNVTHNLGPMFREAGVDWHDYENGDRSAAFLAVECSTALGALVDYPERFRAMNPPNGWGTYEGAVAFLARLIIDCAKHPEAKVEVSL